MSSKERRNGAVDSAASNDEARTIPSPEKALVKANGAVDPKRFADEDEIEPLTIEEAAKEKAEENGEEKAEEKGGSAEESRKSAESLKGRRWEEERKMTYDLKKTAESDSESETPSSVTLRERWQVEYRRLRRMEDLTRGVPAGGLVTFYRNGDAFFPGINTVVNTKFFVNLDSLKVWLTEKITTPSGVRYIFSLRTGLEVLELKQVRPGEAYIVSSVKRLVPGTDYGTGKTRWRWNLKRVSAGKVRHGESKLYLNTAASEPSPSGPNTPNWDFPDSKSARGASSGLPAVRHGVRATRGRGRGYNGYHSQRRPPRPLAPLAITAPKPRGQPKRRGALTPSPRRNLERTIKIVSNTHRFSQDTVFLSPYTNTTFEKMLEDFTQLLQVEFPPVMTLYTMEPTIERVHSFAKLNTEYKLHDTFIACGRELVPFELKGGYDLTDDVPRFAKMRKPRRAMETDRYERFPRAQTHQNEDSDQPRPVGMDRAIARTDDPAFSQLGRPAMRHRMGPKGMAPKGMAPKGMAPKGMAPKGMAPKVPAPMTNGIEQRHGDKVLSPDWIYGVNADALPRSLSTMRSGEVVYPVGRVVVLHSPLEQRQRWFLDHNGVVTCCSVHPTEMYIASGQQGNARNPPCVKIWDTIQLRTVVTLFDNHFQDTVWSVEFSKESRGKYIIVLDGESQRRRQSLYLFSWREHTLLARTSTAHDHVLTAAFHGMDDSTLVTFGRHHLHFWRVFWSAQPGGVTRILRDKLGGDFGEDPPPTSVLCVTYDLEGNVITGDSDGTIRVWTMNEDDAFVQTAGPYQRGSVREPIAALHMLGDGTLLSGSFASVTAWDALSEFSFVREVKMERGWGKVISICALNPLSIDGQLLIGLTGGVVAFGSVQEGFCQLIRGHIGERTLVSANPRDHSFVTCSDDGYLHKWSMIQHAALWSINVEKPCSSVAHHPQGHLVLTGTVSGRFFVFDNGTGTHVMALQIAVDPIQAIKFSTDMQLVAFGVEDGCIHLFPVDTDGLVFRGYRESVMQEDERSKWKAHGSGVSFLDWDGSSRILRSQDVEGIVKAWDVDKMIQLDEFETRDTKFQSSDCMVAVQLRGLWDRVERKSAWNVGSQSSHKDFFCIGMISGQILLVPNSGMAEKDKFLRQHLHQGSVCSISFAFDDSFLLSADECSSPCVIQWRLDDRPKLM